MSKDPIFDEPMKQLIITLSAWRRLITKAKELENNLEYIGSFILYYMDKAWEEAEKDMKDSEKDLMRKIKEAKK